MRLNFYSVLALAAFSAVDVIGVTLGEEPTYEDDDFGLAAQTTTEADAEFFKGLLPKIPKFKLPNIRDPFANMKDPFARH